VKRLAKDDALAGVRSATCIPCELAREGLPLVASERAVAVLDRYACRPGHVLVVLRRHVESIATLEWSEYAELQQLAWRVARGLDRLFAPRRIFIAALGSAEPLAISFPHVHLHVVPLSDGGEADRPASVFTWSHGVYVFEDAAEETALRDRLAAVIDPA
jgi:histidine triad (HIT) family protein